MRISIGTPERGFVLWVGVIFLGLLGQAGPQKDLPPLYRDWLEKEAAHIMAPKEKEVFLELQTDKERDIFIDAFWKQRDPTPGTPKNEFREEHYRRIAYADEFYGRGTTRPGRETERGRIHILLGPPQDISTIDGNSALQPAQIWSYQGNPELGMPSNFLLVFFKRWGSGDYTLYSPVQDGPASLLVNYQGDPTNSSQAYQQLRKFDPRLAEASISLIPGEATSLGRPSLSSDMLLNKLSSIPEKSVDWRYAEALLRFKDLVEVDYSANYIRSEGLVRAVQDESGVFFVHYSVQPDTLSVLELGGKYEVSFDLNGIVSAPDGRIVFQFERTYPLSFDRTEILDIQKTGVVIQDSFPLVPGDYSFGLLLKNTVSKEFTSFEASLSIPGPGVSFAISPLLLGYRFKVMPPVPRMIKPFRFGDVELSCQAQNVFNPDESLVVFWQTFNPGPDLLGKGKAEFVFFRRGTEFRREETRLADLPPRNVFREFLLSGFPPDYYTVKVSIIDPENRELAADKAEFVVSPRSDLPRPWAVAKVMPPADHGMYAFLLGQQLERKGDLAGAEGYLSRAFRSNPRVVDYAVEYSRVLIKRKDFMGARDILSRFLDTPGKDFQVLALLGSCSEGMGDDGEAVSYYQDYLSHAGLVPSVLNSLGDCLLRMGKTADALSTWEKSLEISPGQTELALKIQELKKKIFLLGFSN